MKIRNKSNKLNLEMSANNFEKKTAFNSADISFSVNQQLIFNTKVVI